jgi:hypothetical protein
VLVIAQLTHPPELCLGRPEHKEQRKKLMEYLVNIEKYEKQEGVKIHGFYLNSNEHTFFIILEADKYYNISKFLDVEPLLTHHTAKITPVVTLEEILAFAKSVTD